MPKPTKTLCDSDLKNLRESGLSDATIRDNGLKTEGDKLTFPYRDLDGTLNGFVRYRPHNPQSINGKTAKYIQPPGTQSRAYFPVASLPQLREDESDIYITEGEKKGLALSQLHLTTIAIGGIWTGCRKESDELIDDLQAISWAGRRVYIVFDFDPKPETRKSVDAARKRLAIALRRAGAREVFAVLLPPGPDGTKQGVDDLLVSHGEDYFYGLVQQAVPVVSVVPVVPVVTTPILGEAAYHGVIGEFLRLVAPYTEATDAGILAHLLPAICTIIGPGPFVCTSGAKQTARINTVLVGPTSSGRKGTSFVPVDLLMELVDKDFWEQQRVGGLSTGEGLVGKVADKRTYNKETMDYDVTPVEKRLYVLEEEFSRVLAQIRRDGNILSQILRESFDSGNLSVMTRKEPLQAVGAHICNVGHITPTELADRFNHIEMANGFGNRFLWFLVQSDKLLPMCEPIPPSTFQKIASRLRAIMNSPAKQIPLATASKEKWKEIYPTLREDKPGFAGEMQARRSSMVLRLALIYFLSDTPSRQRQGILPEHLDAAMAVWRYCENSVDILFAGQAGTGLSDKILKLLANGPMTKDEFNPHLSATQKKNILPELMKLEKAGMIHKTFKKPDAGGRPAQVWCLKI